LPPRIIEIVNSRAAGRESKLILNSRRAPEYISGVGVPNSSDAAPSAVVHPIFKATATSVLLAAVVMTAGVGLVAALSARGNAETWTRWSDVGQAFGVVNSVVSALAVVVVLMQARMMRAQQAEQVEQGRTQQATLRALSRTADVDVRKLHMSLIGIALEHPDLADVWPWPANISATKRSQHMYANLLIQHTWLQYTAGICTEDETLSTLRFLLSSPKIRAFWRDTAASREGIYVDGTDELDLAAAADAIWAEYARAAGSMPDRSPRP
jgi:hypothetical protein